MPDWTLCCVRNNAILLITKPGHGTACIRPRFGFCKAVDGLGIPILRAVRFLLLSTACSVLLAGGGDPISFNRDVRPILSDRCYACHGPESRSRQAGLRLDSEESAKSPLKSGHVAVLPGELSKSALFARVTSSDKSLRMPPASAGRDALTPAETEILKRWIEQGAVWQQHWSFIPPTRAAAPPGRNPIDYFVTSHLNKEGLRPSPAGRSGYFVAPRHAGPDRLTSQHWGGAGLSEGPVVRRI